METRLTGRTVTWASSAPSIAIVDGSGKVTGLTAGSATISATCEGKTASSAITVTVTPFAAVSVVHRSAARLPWMLGSRPRSPRSRPIASGKYAGRPPMTWSTGNATIATVSTSGLVSAIGAGTDDDHCNHRRKGRNYSGCRDFCRPSAAHPRCVGYRFTAASSLNTRRHRNAFRNCARLYRRTFDRIASLRGRLARSVSRKFQRVAWLPQSHPALRLSPPRSETKSGIVIVNVVLPTDPVASVTITPSSATMVQDSMLIFTATLKDAAGTVLTGRTVTWGSNLTTVATVDSSTGLVTASHTATGNAVISAKSEGVTGFSVVTVIQKPVAAVSSNSGSRHSHCGQSRQRSSTPRVTATAGCSQGALSTGR